MMNLDSLRSNKFQLITPLYVDTFPLAYFYATGCETVGGMVQFVDWDDWDKLPRIHSESGKGSRNVLAYAQKPVAAQWMKEIDRFNRGRSTGPKIECSVIDISKFLVKRFFASNCRALRGKTTASIEEFVKALSSEKECYTHSEQGGVADICLNYIKQNAEHLDVELPLIIDNVNRTNLNKFSANRIRNGAHVYTFGEIGQRLIKNTFQEEICEIAVPDSTSIENDRSQLVVFLAFAAGTAFDKQNEIKEEIKKFHSNLFDQAKDESEGASVFDEPWESFSTVFMRTLPIDGLFQSPGEYRKCFNEHHQLAL